MQSKAVLGGFEKPFNLPPMPSPPHNRAGFEGFSREHIALRAFLLTISFQVEPGDGDRKTQPLSPDTLPWFVSLKEVPSTAEFAVVAHPIDGMQLQLTDTLEKVHTAEGGIRAL